jgi:hypothetical protein
VARDRVTIGTVVKLALASLLVGLVLSFLGVTPADLLDRVAGLAAGLWDTVHGALGWAGSYMLLGALVVLPLWLIRFVWRRMSRAGDG